MEKVPKIRVFWSDGRGTALWDQRTGPEDRVWFAPPAADYTESLHALAGGLFLRCFHSKHPKLTGSPERSDLFDADSRAIRCTQGEARQWLQNHGYGVPTEWSEDPGTAPANGQSAEVQMERLTQIVGDESAVEILRITERIGLSNERKFEEILKIDARYAGKTSDEIGLLLGVKGAAVRQWGIWKRLHPKRASE